ncbi:MAG: glycoside hydrolase family 2 TIM barrel-domain containing protein [bacterium]
MGTGMRDLFAWPLAFFMAFSLLAGEGVSGARQTLDFNQGWRFLRMDAAAEEEHDYSSADTDDRAWEAVNVPHTVRLEPENASGCRNFQGLCWYRRHFTAEDTWAGRSLELTFEGAMQVAEVWLNGHKLTTHYGGYLPFALDLTGLVKPGADNVLALRLDNRDNRLVPPGCPQKGLDFTYYGGLYRNVRLEVKEPLHITHPVLADRVAGGGVFVTFPEVTATQATVRVRTEIANRHDRAKACTLRQELVDATGLAIAATTADGQVDAGACRTFDQTLTVANPKLWHPYHPDLYTLRTTVLAEGKSTDAQETRVGIRTFRIEAGKGLTINGERFYSMGVNRHQDYVYVGNALPDSGQWRDVKKLREAGFTSFRSHYPQSPAFMDACDELGILCIVSTPGWHNYAKEAVFRERVWSDVRNMVRRDRNRPSVIMWEVGLNESGYTREYAEGAHRAVHEEYPGGPCYTVGDGRLDWQKADPVFDVLYTAFEGLRPYWRREAGDADNMNWSEQFARNRVMRGWGEAAQLTQAASHLRCVGNMAGTTGSGGWCLWAGIDHDRGYHPLPFLGGVLDRRRLPKFDFWAFASQRDPDVRLAVCDSGPLVRIAHLATHFSPHDVTVFSNCEEVRLLRDGKEVSVQKPDRAGSKAPHPAFLFSNAWDGTTGRYDKSQKKWVWEWSTLSAEGLIGGKVVATHAVRPPGIPRSVSLTAEDGGRPLVADGSDFMPVRITLTDDKGVLAPVVDLPVTVSVEGAGCVIGDGSIGANPVKTEFGETTVLIRAATKPGLIRIRATADGLKEGVLELRSVSAPLRFAPGRDVGVKASSEKSMRGKELSRRAAALATPDQAVINNQIKSQDVRDRQ